MPVSRGLGSPSLLGLTCPFPLSQVAISPGSCRLPSAGANRAPAQPASKARTRSRDRFPEESGGPIQPLCSITNGPTTLRATLSTAAPPSLPPPVRARPPDTEKVKGGRGTVSSNGIFFGWGSGQQGHAFPEGQASFRVWLPSPLIG